MAHTLNSVLWDLDLYISRFETACQIVWHQHDATEVELQDLAYAEARQILSELPKNELLASLRSRPFAIGVKQVTGDPEFTYTIASDNQAGWSDALG